MMYEEHSKEELEEAIRRYDDRLDENSPHWDKATSRSLYKRLKDLVKREDKCVCKYHSKTRKYPYAKEEKEYMFHIRDTYGEGVDVSVFKGEIGRCKECGEEKHVSTRRKRKSEHNTYFIKYENMAL